MVRLHHQQRWSAALAAKVDMSKTLRVATMTTLAMISVGCHAVGTGRLQAKASTSGGAEVNGDATVEADADAKAEKVAPVAPVVKYDKEAGTIDYKGTIDFAYDDDRLAGAGTFQVLDELAGYLKKLPKVDVQVEGHTDSRGTPAYNESLSARRAGAIRAYLIEKGIAAARITTKGYGEQHADKHEPKECLNQLPKDTAPCEAAWEKSRRAVFKVTAGAETIQEEPPEAPPPAKKTEPRIAHVEDEAPPKRVWFLAAHLGVALPMGDAAPDAPLDAYVGKAIPIGIGVGYWLSQRTALGFMAEYAPVLPAEDYCARRPSAEQPCTLGLWRWRTEGFLEFHGSTGPTASAWFGLGLGFEGLSLRVQLPTVTGAQMRVGPYVAARGGLDLFATRQLRIGPFAELTVAKFLSSSTSFPADSSLEGAGAGHGYVGIGLRGAYDFFDR